MPLVLMHKSTALDMIQGAPKCTISTKRCQMNESVPMLILNEVMLFLLRDSDRQQQHGAICTVNFCPSDCTPGEKGKFGYPLTAFSARRLLAEALGLWKSILCSLVGTGQLLWSRHHCQQQLALFWPCLCCSIPSHFRAEGADLAVMCSLPYL